MIPHKNVNSSCNEVSGEPVAGFLATESLQGLTMVRSWPGEGLLGMVRLAWLALPAGTLEKEMAAHSSTLAWRIPWTEVLGRLQPMGSQRVGHD